MVGIFVGVLLIEDFADDGDLSDDEMLASIVTLLLELATRFLSRL